MSDWATYEDRGGAAVLRFERRLAHPPEAVFRAITDPDELRHWFPARVDTELRAGAPVRFSFGDEAAEAPDGEVLEVDPPRVFAFTWGGDVLRWEVVPEPGGCRLVFVHTIAEGRSGVARNGAGWDVCLAQLGARLDGRAEPELPWFPRFEGYADRFGLGEGELDGGTLRFVRDAVAAREVVWAHLTEGAVPAVGGPAPRRFGPAPPGEVTAVQPERLLACATADGSVRWELEQGMPGALVTVTVALDDPDAAPAALAAWQVHLELLIAAVHGEERCWPADRVAELERRYAGAVRAAARP